MANLSKERWDAAVREHQDILRALTARDVTKLKRLLRDHLANKMASVLTGIEKAA
jgi:DNA-binding GntR family transcriptional regulator